MTDAPETQTEEENGQEPPTPPDAPPGTEEADREDEEHEAASQTPAQAAAKDGSDEIPKKLERAIGDQRKRLSKIIGVDLEGQECPTCDGMGYTIGGGDPEAGLVTPDNFEMCSSCNGAGFWDAPTRNLQHKHPVCTKCSGYGYLTVSPQPSNVMPIQPAQTMPASPVMGFQNPDGTFTPFGVNTPQTVESGA